MNRILKNWDAIRIIRLMLGAVVVAYAISSEEYAFLILGGLLLFQAIMNVSCCGASGCNTAKGKSKENIYGDQIKKYNRE